MEERKGKLEGIRSQKMHDLLIQQIDVALNECVKRDSSGNWTEARKHPKIKKLFYAEALKFVIDDQTKKDGTKKDSTTVDLRVYRGAKGRDDMNIGYIWYYSKDGKSKTKSRNQIIICDTKNGKHGPRNAFIRRPDSNQQQKPKAEKPLTDW